MIIKVGDKVKWSGCFGAEPEKDAIVIGIELCENGSKYGMPVKAVYEKHIEDAVFSLDNGHWAYGHQIKPKRR